MAETKRMTKGERDDLMRLVRGREKVLKTAAGSRASEMMAEFEENISAIYNFDSDIVWKQIYQEAASHVIELRKKIVERCDALKIPEEFRPTLGIYWQARGENMVNERRIELRRKAKTSAEAMEQRARAEIERLSVEAQTEILSSGLETDAARMFLEKMPSMDKLMPALEAFKMVEEIDAARKAQRERTLRLVKPEDDGEIT